MSVCIGCEYNDNNDPKNIKVEEKYNYNFENDIPYFADWQQAAKWVANNISYKLEESDYWKLPQETYNSKNGDCEDFSILLAYILYENLQINDVKLVRIQTETKGYHLIVQIGEIYIEAQTGKRIYYIPPDIIKWIATYPEVIWMTINYHDSVGKYL
jgi:hypothetical protein